MTPEASIPVDWPSSLPKVHRRFLELALGILPADLRVMGLAAGGSYLANAMDELSDLDLVIATQACDHASVMAERRGIAGLLGRVLAAFTGEHVGEPRLLICLYDGDPPLHVDLKFVALPDLATRVENPAVLWERDGQLSRALREGACHYPRPDLQWIEDRVWVWVHYAATKIGRGEIFEVLDFLSFFRTTVLGPLALDSVGARPAGVRKIEMLAPDHAQRLRATVGTYDAADCARALHSCIDCYRQLRAGHTSFQLRDAAEAASLRYLADIEAGLNRIAEGATCRYE